MNRTDCGPRLVQGATFKDSQGEPFIKIAAMTFHVRVYLFWTHVFFCVLHSQGSLDSVAQCLVMGKKSGWSKKQTAVIMERDPVRALSCPFSRCYPAALGRLDLAHPLTVVQHGCRMVRAWSPEWLNSPKRRWPHRCSS